ncbi:5'-3' DNA helicase ZGRF1 isoform X2 [Microcaecilia unicolor]|uniref:Protein ZGRF1 isoform X2 n=1 Tax=Microcaecilia unicolor TaxID=1415580 RepID=A0A6P7X801_9AMPH|nr:protein ZGRF1 isoform X2 [Microcaecilia unicolor]
MSCLEFTVLYTHQKARKSKIWQDGILKMSSEGNKADLFDAQGKCLECVFLKGHKVEPGDDLESDRFLIMVESEKFTECNSNDKSAKKESPKTSSRGLKSFGLPQLQQHVGLKRKSTGFQGPCEIPKKAADEVRASAISFPTKRLYASPSLFYSTSSLSSTVCREDTEINLTAATENAIWKNSVTSTKRPGAAFSSLLSASSMHFPKKIGENEKCSLPITVDATAEQLKNKVPSLYLTGDFQTPSGVSVSQNIRSRAKILALLKSNPSSVIEESSVGVAQCHPGAQSRESTIDLPCSTIDGCTNTVLENSSEQIQQQHPSSSLSMKCNISKSKWDIYLPKRPRDPSNNIDEKHQEEVPGLHLGLQEPRSQGNVSIFTTQQPHENDGACSDRFVENQQSSWDQNVTPWLSTLGKNDGAHYKSLGNQHVPRYRENKKQTSESNVRKSTEIPSTSTLEGFNYSRSSKESFIFQENSQNVSKTWLTDSIKDPKVSPAAPSSVCRLSPRMVLESLGEGIESIADDDIAFAGRDMKDALTVSRDFRDSLQHFAGITFNLLDNFDFVDSEEEELQEGSSLPPSSERSMVRNGVRSPEKMTNSQGKSDLISDLPPSANGYIYESSANGEVLLVEKISMKLDRIVNYDSPVMFHDLKPSESEYTEHHINANTENLQSIDERRNFDLSQISGITNSLTMNDVHCGAFEHKRMTNCEFHSQIQSSRETELLSESPVDICFPAPDVSKKDVIIRKRVPSLDSSLSYRDLNSTSDSPLLTISLKSGDEDSRTLIKEKLCTVSSKTDKIQEDPYLIKSFSQSSAIKHLSEELEACADLSSSTSSVSGHQHENSGANCQKQWTSANKSPELSGLVNGMFLLKDLSEHSTALESLEMMRGENTDLFLKTNGIEDKDDPIREIKV